MFRKKAKRGAEKLTPAEEEALKQKKLKAQARAWLKTCKSGKPEDFPPIVLNVKSIPVQRIRDKLAHDMMLNMTESWTDFEKKVFVIEYTPNGFEIEKRVITFDEACKNFGWKSMTFSENKMTAYPKW